MATVTVNISATDNMSPVIASLQQQLNQLQQQANVLVGGRMGQAANQMANYSARLFESMLNSMGTKLWKSFTNNLKSAYNEIKAIDDELVVVRRITGKTNEELTGMTKNAMNVAQAYGIAASKYLSGVADFTRAGYQGQAESLAELSVKLQRAGDVSADVANQYILAIDKAYGLQGNIEALTAAMDGANQIGNEYATNVGEIAAGIGKVATIASTAHVGINELTAALGTITAVTQRSGTEAATALRAIFLNIMGDTSTEIEEGAKWTAGEIEGLRQVLELYAPEVVRAAEATGTLIDPMEAIGALAKSYQDGVLTEAKLFSMVSDIGGKLRTNQLMVLIKNWDMYESMLKTYAGASGSIDREVANSLDSITVKTEQLKASWVALVNSTVSTGMIKGVLDRLNTAVQAVDNLGNALTIVLGLVTALKAQRIATLFGGMFRLDGNWVEGATRGIRGFGAAVTAVAAAFTIANGIIQNYNAGLQKQIEGATAQSQGALTSSNEILTLYNAYVTATAGSEEYTLALQALAEALGLTSAAAAEASGSIDNLTISGLKQAAADAKAALDSYNNARTSMKPGVFEKDSYVGFLRSLPEGMQEIAKAYSEFSDALIEVQSAAPQPGFKINKFTTAEVLVENYEKAVALQRELNAYAFDNGLKVSDYSYYNSLSAYISEMETEYSTAVAYINNLATTVANLDISILETTSRIADAEKDLADGKADAFSTEEIEAFAASLDKLAQSYDQTTVQGRKNYEAVMKQMANLFPNLIKYSKEYANWAGKEVDTSSSVDNTTESVKKLTVALSEATKAKNAFDEAMKQAAENEGFKNYQDAYAAYAEEMKAGRVNSKRAMAAAEYLMAGSDEYNFEELYRTGGYKSVNAAMKKGPWATVYGNADLTYGEGFVKLLDKIVKTNGNVVDSNGKVVASYKNVNGQVKFTVNDLEGLADATDMGLDQVWQAIKALSVYGNVETNIDDFTAQLKELGTTAGFIVDTGDVNKLGIDYKKLLDYAKESEMTPKEWDNMKQWLNILNEMGEVEIQNVPENWKEENELQTGPWVPETAEFTVEPDPESEEDIKEKVEEWVPDTVPVDVEPDTKPGDGGNDFQALYDEYNRVLTELDALIASKDYTLTFNADGWPAIHTIEAIETDADEVTRERTIQFDANGNVVSTLEILKNKAGEVAETRTINYNANGTIDNIDVVRADAANPDLLEHLVYYYTNGKIDHIDFVKTKAGEPVGPHLVAYYTDGKIDHIEWVDEAAHGLETHDYQIHYGTDGTITGLTDTIKTATGVQDIEYQFLFGTDGQIIGLKQTEETAEGVKYKIHTFTFSADGKLLSDKIEEYTVYADGTTSDPIKYTLDADDDPAVGAIQTVLELIEDDYAGQQEDYGLGADTDGVTTGVETAEAAIADSIATTNTTYHLKAVFDGLSNPMSIFASLDPSDPLYNPGGPLSDPLKGRPLGEVLAGLGSRTTGQPQQTVETELEIVADKESAAKAATEAQKIASLTLGANPVPFIPEEGYDGEYAGQWDGNDIYTVSFEIENEGVFDDIMYIDKESGKPHVISIQTAGDGAQTITETVYTLDGAVESQNVITVDASGNAETNLQSLEALVEFLNRTFNITVQTNTGNSTSQLNRIKDLLDSIKSKTVTVTTKTVGATELKDPKDPEKVATAATGAANFNSGYALINEEGPELVAADGMASIYANGFPTIAQIPNGATIYTAEETARMLGGKMSLPAYADGKYIRTPAVVEVTTELEIPKPKPKEEEEEKPKETVHTPKDKNGDDEEGDEEFWDTIRKYIEYGLKKIMYQIEGYQDDIEAIEKARDKLLHPIEEELEDLTYTLTLLEYEVTLLERARDDAVKPLDKEIERLEKARDISREEYDLEEKRQALEDARNQRTIRQFNEETGQWEWVADQKAIADAEKAYNDAMADYEISQLKRERDAIYDSYQDEIEALEEQEEVIKRRQEDLEIEKTKIEYEYNEMIEPLQEKVDELQGIYDDLEKYYNHLVDAVEVPTEDLTEALEQMRQAEERYANQVEETVKLLNTLYDLAPTWSPVRVEDTITQYRPGYDPIKGTTTTITNVYIDGVNIDGQEATAITHILKKHRMYHGG